MHLGFKPNSFGGGTHYAIGEHPQTGGPALIVSTVFGSAFYEHPTEDAAIAAGLEHIADGGWLTTDLDNGSRGATVALDIRDAVSRLLQHAAGKRPARIKMLRRASDLPGIGEMLESGSRVDAATMRGAHPLYLVKAA